MTKTYPKRNPDRRPTHPGAVLRDIVVPALISEHKLTKTAIAKGLAMSRNQFHLILAEKQPVTPETAVKLEAALGGSADMWLTMQADYDLWGAKRSIDLKGVKQLRAA